MIFIQPDDFNGVVLASSDVAVVPFWDATFQPNHEILMWVKWEFDNNWVDVIMECYKMWFQWSNAPIPEASTTIFSCYSFRNCSDSWLLFWIDNLLYHILFGWALIMSQLSLCYLPLLYIINRLYFYIKLDLNNPASLSSTRVFDLESHECHQFSRWNHERRKLVRALDQKMRESDHQSTSKGELIGKANSNQLIFSSSSVIRD